MKDFVIGVALFVASLAVGIAANYATFDGKGLVHYLQHRNDTMVIPASSPTNTHCFFADELGVHLSLEVRPGTPVPTDVRLYPENMQDMWMSAHNTGYGEVFSYKARLTNLMNPLTTRLTEVQCVRR